MSMEQAINEHASAIRELAAAIAGAFKGSSVGLPLVQLASLSANVGDLEAAATKVETDAKVEQKKVMAAVEADRKPSTAKEAIADALARAKADKAKPAAEEDDPLDAAPLDWDKDVRPALLAVGKDRDALVKLMAKYDVPKGGKAPAEKWADLLAEANAIVAARG